MKSALDISVSPVRVTLEFGEKYRAWLVHVDIMDRIVVIKTQTSPVLMEVHKIVTTRGNLFLGIRLAKYTSRTGTFYHANVAKMDAMRRNIFLTEHHAKRPKTFER